MKTMYIASNNSFETGHFVGDMLGIVKVAWLFARNEPHEQYVLSLHEGEPLNFLWDRFMRKHGVRVVFDRWDKGDRDERYRQFDARRAARRVHDIPFDTYKEMYPRLDGGPRQGALCDGVERGLGRRNIFEYYYFGQEQCHDDPVGTTEFGRGVIDLPAPSLGPHDTDGPSLWLAPHEKCEGNRVFTHAFWADVVGRLLEAGVRVTVNDGGTPFMAGFAHPRFARAYPPFGELLGIIRRQHMVVCGNTGIGWVAGACEAPLVAAERDLIFTEYSFEKSGLRSLRAVIREPDPTAAARTILDALDDLAD